MDFKAYSTDVILENGNANHIELQHAIGDLVIEVNGKNYYFEVNDAGELIFSITCTTKIDIVSDYHLRPAVKLISLEKATTI